MVLTNEYIGTISALGELLYHSAGHMRDLSISLCLSQTIDTLENIEISLSTSLDPAILKEQLLISEIHVHYMSFLPGNSSSQNPDDR